jgi:AcrR family transcriptional regulator
MKRMTPRDRREAIVAAALAVARRKGLAGTTVRDVASEMGTSSGLIHHYFPSMDEVLATAFETVAAADLEITRAAMAEAAAPADGVATFFRTYGPLDQDWAFQLWLDAWAEAARRPLVRAASRRLNLEWHALLLGAIERGVGDGSFRCPDPTGAAWRLLSIIDGLALQVVAHGDVISRSEMLRWAATAAEAELGLADGAIQRRL